MQLSKLGFSQQADTPRDQQNDPLLVFKDLKKKIKSSSPSEKHLSHCDYKNVHFVIITAITELSMSILNGNHFNFEI